MPDNQELVYLRVSVARIAQALGIETKRLPVLNKGTRSLVKLAIEQGRGWNDLSSQVANRLKDGVLIQKADAKILAKALRQFDPSDYASALALKLLGEV